MSALLVSTCAFCPFPQPTRNIKMMMKKKKKGLLKISCKSSCPPLSNSRRLTESSVPVEKTYEWNAFQKMVGAILDTVESRIIGKQEALPKTVDPEVQLAGNFAPVPEREAASGPLEVEGKVPDALAGGVYIRNGANPLAEPRAGHHLFDGDGMLHAVRFHKSGIATYCCRYTRTYRFQMEQTLGRAFFPKAIGELHGRSGLVRLLLFYARSLFGLVKLDQGMGTANAGLLFFNGRLLAMSEDDLPYAVKITDSGNLQTLGRYSFDGQLTNNSSMIAHPKIDAHTGEMFALSYDVIKPPYLRYFKFSRDGVKGPDVSISLSEPTMVHDFAITENYVVIPDQQVVFRLHRMLSGGSPVVMDSLKMPRFGILPRDDTDERRLKWIDVPDCFCFHLWNAWEDGDDVVIIGSHMTPPDSIFNESDLPLRSLLSEIRLNKKTGTSTRRQLVANLNLEAGQVNRNRLGRKTRYAYLAIAEPWPKVSGIAKVDLIPGHDDHGDANDDQNVVAKFMYEPGCYGGEALFVPRSSNPEAAKDEDEDEGYVLTFVHNEKSGESSLLILDAASGLQPIASVKLPSRVPYGFHGTFITANELAQQHQAA